ncbi:MAG: hypothetical protein ACRDYU_08875 [Actinomycetes bacterium]
MVRTVRLMVTLAVGAMIGALLVGGMGAAASVGLSSPAPAQHPGSPAQDDTASPDSPYAARDDQAVELVAGEDDGDDDDSASGATGTRTRSRNGDNTNTNNTNNSRHAGDDRDHSRGDITGQGTKDDTRGQSTGDQSRDHAGDGSRHDTR